MRAPRRSWAYARARRAPIRPWWGRSRRSRAPSWYGRAQRRRRRRAGLSSAGPGARSRVPLGLPWGHGGQPLLLGQLLRSLGDDAVRPGAARAALSTRSGRAPSRGRSCCAWRDSSRTRCRWPRPWRCWERAPTCRASRRWPRWTSAGPPPGPRWGAPGPCRTSRPHDPHPRTAGSPRRRGRRRGREGGRWWAGSVRWPGRCGSSTRPGRLASGWRGRVGSRALSLNPGG